MTRLRSQILLASITFASLLIGGGSLVMHELGHWGLATEQVRLSHERGVLDGQLQTAITRATGEMATYLLSGDLRYRRESERALAQAQRAIEKIRAIEDNERSLPIIGNQWHTSLLPVPPKPPPSGLLARQEQLLDQVVLALARAERRKQAGAGDAAILREVYAPEEMADQLWRDATMIHRAAQEESEKTMEQHSRLIGVLFVACLAAVALATVLLLSFIGRHVVRPLQGLAEAAGRVAGGSLYTRVPVAYRNEIGQLQGRFNEMVENLAGQRTEIRRLVDSLTRARDAAEKASRAKSDFLAKMSHEIRTPMHGISLTLDLLHDMVRDDNQRELTAVARQSARTLADLIDDTLDFTRIESGHLRLEMAVFDLREMLAGIEQLEGRRAEAKGLQWEIRVDGGVPPRVWGDSLRLTQVLRNLLDNAIRFTDSGGVTVTVDIDEYATPPAVVKPPGPKPPVCVRFTVVDTGIGIAPEMLEGIFDPFRQADESTTRRFGGSGLGLAIVRQIVEMMDGKVEVESTPGSGSRFSVAIWFRPDPRRKVRQGPQPTVRDPLPAGKALLLVEDNAGNRMVIERLLRRAGVEVETAENGRVAIDAANRRHFDMILMDCFMPEVDGFQAARAIRAGDGPSCKAPIIALTAFALDEGVLNSRESGMDGFLSKPYTEEQLFQLLHHWLDEPAARPAAEKPA